MLENLGMDDGHWPIRMSAIQTPLPQPHSGGMTEENPVVYIKGTVLPGTPELSSCFFVLLCSFSPPHQFLNIIMATLTITEPSSSNSDIELQAPSTPYFADKKRASMPETEPQDRTGSQQKLGHSNLEDVRQDAVAPDTAVEALQTWHSPRINMYRVFATFWSFFTVGMNDGSYGVC